VWTVTGADGRFTLPVQPVHAIDELTEPPTYALAAISQSGYALVDVPAEGKDATIKLMPLISLARLELAPVADKPQRIDLSLRGMLPDKSPGFAIFEIQLRDKPLPLAVPPGKIIVSRSFEQKDGISRSYVAETLQLGPGESQMVTLPNITEEEAKRKRIEEFMRSKDNAPGR
jgi:hypothetical protein